MYVPLIYKKKTFGVNIIISNYVALVALLRLAFI